ncbi:hypothetical protein ACRARG_06475 [Pseudooceanicola sp. C21-150M6]|uniref:hypothetical protein n=1 Tax=Pseudooceanicola sp. C21-150M6 TaxID=3434355 RepID=UPI003D7F5900
MKLLIAAVISFAAFPALANTNMASGMVEVRDRTQISEFGINSDLADDLDVYDANGRKIGEIEEIVGPDRRTAQAIVVDFDDDMAGADDHERLFPLTAFSFDGSGLVMADISGIKDAPIWRD